MPRSTACCFALCLGAVLAACPAPKLIPPEDAGTLVFVGRLCNVDAECGGLRCDKVRRQCICLSDESCKSADPADPVRYCNNYTGLCVTEIAGCTGDADCKDAAGNPDPTMYCDSSVRACRPLKTFCEPCTANSECGGAQDNCLLDSNLGQKFCSKACNTTADCPRGSACSMLEGQLQCWPAPNPLQPEKTVSCKDFRGCVPDSLRSCGQDAGCTDLGDQRCDYASGKCIAVEQVCPFGTVCDPRNRICVAECSADADCGDTKLRCVNRVCEPIGECANDSQCPLNKICSIAPGQTLGQCQPFCTADVDCALGNVCVKGTDARYRCVAGCNSNSNCPIDQRCNTTSKQCEGPLVGTTLTCQATVACNNCQLCNLTSFACFDAKGTYPHCLPCTGSTECTGGACVLMADAKTYCAKFCGTGQECPQGFVCTSIGVSGQFACVPSDGQCATKCK